MTAPWCRRKGSSRGQVDGGSAVDGGSGADSDRVAARGGEDRTVKTSASGSDACEHGQLNEHVGKGRSGTARYGCRVDSPERDPPERHYRAVGGGEDDNELKRP